MYKVDVFRCPGTEVLVEGSLGQDGTSRVTHQGATKHVRAGSSDIQGSSTSVEMSIFTPIVSMLK